MISANKSFKELTRGKVWVKPTDQMDLWLDSQGYYRKHTAKDGSCLYRAVSEQVFLAQAFHLDVRRHCAEYAQRHPELLDSVNYCTKKEYVDRMKHPHEAGGKLELELMSRMYKRDFLLFNEPGKLYEPVTDHGFDKQIMLCLSQEHHYDSVYTKQYISNAAFCQSLIYETLYKKVFQLEEVDYAVKKMLHDKTSKYQRDPSSFFMNGLDLRLEIRDSYSNVKNLLNLGVTPFPYKVAKSLDPDIYRNVEYDTWNEIRRGLRYGMYMWNNRELQVGVKCLVKLPSDRVCHAHIQDMSPDKGPVIVFVEELGEKMSVSYESLELLPQSPPSQPLSLPLKQLRQLQTLRELTSLDDLKEVLDNEDKSNNADTPSSHNSEKEMIWKSEHDRSGAIAPKLKMFNDLSKSNKKTNRSYRIKSKELTYQPSSESHKRQMEDNAVVSSTSDCNYSPSEVSATHHRENVEEYNPNSFNYQAIDHHAERERPEQITVEATSTVGPPAMVCIEPHFYMQPMDGFAPPSTFLAPPACYPPTDLQQVPVTDIAPLRFYYNYGIEHYSQRVRPTPPCYLNTAVTYLPDNSMSPAVYDHGPSTPITTPDSAVVMSPSPVFRHPRPDSLPLLPMPPEPDSTTHHSYYPSASHNLAPRFKNKLRNMQAGRPCEPPVVQQPEVSSTTSVPVPAHYLAPPLYYHPLGVEVESNYLEYGVYDPNLIYFPPVQPAVPPPHYFHPDALFYQHLMAAPLPSAI
ncbi:protein ovarian tumor locus-like [Macrosteles quadrilineatus]|uniref:protein ovarian tumor locus-like n=1 Tax=Macrosteles quadrilineatus TaxID=74068 RepID=UPI0023E1A54D|nr:protein ovarian tumor locus-like [Macrosteles quadrilineatus]